MCIFKAAKNKQRIIFLWRLHINNNTWRKNKLLPNSRHSFRAKRLTMTALLEFHKDWPDNTKRKEITGVLFWDLSAAFYTLNTKLMCEKLKIDGCTQNTCAWFCSYLTDRTQSVKMEVKDWPYYIPILILCRGIQLSIKVHACDIRAWKKIISFISWQFV